MICVDFEQGHYCYTTDTTDNQQTMLLMYKHMAMMPNATEGLYYRFYALLIGSQSSDNLSTFAPIYVMHPFFSNRILGPGSSKHKYTLLV